jgi:hypothetical protein
MEEDGEEEEEGERPDPILHYLRNYFISHTDRETLMESATVINSLRTFKYALLSLIFVRIDPVPSDLS